ncbi:glycosyltransferase family 2 protein [Duganella callida]|uniref:Glycosyltransferase n=1 Tax=Duganella callida TaxID=2561932 RepID=A0A4Y9SBR4_9BURK|nr:glycosyltransferase family 2 protein [Duganella callida]TFW19768.1 glycosyltransferase [Duganella callida]
MQAATSPLISVVIPVYKAEKMLDELYTRLRDAIQTVTPAFEIVLVEDCGGDRSWDVIERLAQADPRVVGLQFSRNFGQHYGITAGLDLCRGDWVVVMDCDLQDAPEEIPRLYAKAQEGYDVVLALRGKRQDPLLKRATSWLYYRLFSYLADIDIDGDSGNFRIMSRQVVKNFNRMREQLRFFGGHVQWMGFPTTGIQVQHAQRAEGKSTYTFAKLWRLASETIIAYSDKPLRMAARLGLTMAAVATAFGLYLLVASIIHRSPIAGWSSLIVSLYFIGGLIIGILGIMGVYLGKAFDETKKRPLYIVRRLTPNARELPDD